MPPRSLLPAFLALAAIPVQAAPAPVGSCTLAIFRVEGAGGATTPQDIDERDFVEETLSTVAAGALGPLRCRVLTREVLVTMMNEDNGTSRMLIAAESPLDVARALKVDLFVSGTLRKIEGLFVVTVRMFDTATATQLNSLDLRGAKLLEVEAELRTKGPRFYTDALAKLTPAQSAPPPVAENAKPGANDGTAVDLSKFTQPAVKFRSEPPGAIVLVDGQLVCRATPCVKMAKIGSHEVTMLLERYDNGRATATFAKGVEVAVTLAASAQ